MTAGELCTRTVRTISARAPVTEAARRMRTHGVGTLVVVDGVSPLEGIVTDRDLAIRALGAPSGPTDLTVGDVMTRGPAAVQDTLPVERALDVMADQGVRRVVVLDEGGGLVGLLALDDVMGLLVREADGVGRLLTHQTPA